MFENSRVKYSLFFIITIIFIECTNVKTKETINLDTRYVLAKEYIYTDPEGVVDIFRFHWTDWRELSLHNFPYKEKIKPVTQRKYCSLDGLYQLIMPKLSGRMILFDDRKYIEEPTARFIMKDENNWVVGIQSTKIRQGYPEDDSLLTAIVGKRRLAVQKNLGTIGLKYFNYSGRIVLEEKIWSASLNLPFFLNGDIEFSNVTGNPVRINRCIVRNGYFIEISVYVISENHTDKKFSEKAALEISDYILNNISFK